MLISWCLSEANCAMQSVSPIPQIQLRMKDGAKIQHNWLINTKLISSSRSIKSDKYNYNQLLYKNS